MANPQLTVFFDGACPICSREIAHYRRRDSEGRLRLVDIAAPSFDAAAEAMYPAHGLVTSLAVVVRERPALASPVIGVLNAGTRVRTDVSATLFLSAPDEYDGGELVIEDTYGTHGVKLPAGDMIVYPGTSLHHVTKVTRGSRLASFFWTESMVADVTRRSMMFDLDMSIIRLTADHPQHPSTVTLTSLYHNLLRQWAV